MRVPGLPVVVTGLGKAASAVATTRALGSFDTDRVEVVNIGAAAALHDHVSGVHVAGVALNHDINAAAIRVLGYDPQERLVAEEHHDRVVEVRARA